MIDCEVEGMGTQQEEQPIPYSVYHKPEYIKYVLNFCFDKHRDHWYVRAPPSSTYDEICRAI